MNTYDRSKQVSVYQDQQRVAALRKANKEGMYVEFLFWEYTLYYRSPSANSQYKHMERVLADPHKPEHAAVIQKAFGDKANVKAIAENVKKLKKETLLVKTVEEKMPGVVAFARTRPEDKKKHLHFADSFFNKKTPLGQAGTLIHEASHQLFDTKDNFEKKTGRSKFKPISKARADKSQHTVKSGCASFISQIYVIRI